MDSHILNYEPRGREFESLRAHQSNKGSAEMQALSICGLATMSPLHDTSSRSITTAGQQPTRLSESAELPWSA